jgi:hypothetical protein
MSHQEFVVKWPAGDNGTDVDSYLQSYSSPVSIQNCNWGNPETAMDFGTLQAAQNFANGINSGTVGTTKPS